MPKSRIIYINQSPESKRSDRRINDRIHQLKLIGDDNLRLALVISHKSSTGEQVIKKASSLLREKGYIQNIEINHYEFVAKFEAGHTPMPNREIDLAKVNADSIRHEIALAVEFNATRDEILWNLYRHSNIGGTISALVNKLNEAHKTMKSKPLSDFA